MDLISTLQGIVLSGCLGVFLLWVRYEIAIRSKSKNDDPK